MKKWLSKTHFISELQLESCYNILYIFGTNINLVIGDSANLIKLQNNQYEVLVFKNDKYEKIDISNFMKDKTSYQEEDAAMFSKLLKKIL